MLSEKANANAAIWVGFVLLQPELVPHQLPHSDVLVAIIAQAVQTPENV
jgi:hypothetical protein